MDIRVVIASEVRLYRESLQRVLHKAAGVALVGVAASGKEVIEQASRLAPIVIVIDMAMVESFFTVNPVFLTPQISGVATLSIPEIAAGVIACLPSSILGSVSRDGTVAVLLDAIRAAGSAQESPLGGSIDDLTAREMEILRLMQQGLSNKTISRRLDIGLSTVKNHVHSILSKLQVRCRGEAISLLYRQENSERQRTYEGPLDDELPTDVVIA